MIVRVPFVVFVNVSTTSVFSSKVRLLEITPKVLITGENGSTRK